MTKSYLVVIAVGFVAASPILAQIYKPLPSLTRAQSMRKSLPTKPTLRTSPRTPKERPFGETKPTLEPTLSEQIVRGKVEQEINLLFRESLSDLPQSLRNADYGTLYKEIEERVVKVARAEATKPNPRWTFDVGNGKLALNSSFDVAGGRFEARELNLYKIAAGVAAAVVVAGKCGRAPAEEWGTCVLGIFVKAIADALKPDATTPAVSQKGESPTVGLLSREGRALNKAWAGYAQTFVVLALAIAGLGLAFFVARRYRRPVVASTQSAGDDLKKRGQ